MRETPKVRNTLSTIISQITLLLIAGKRYQINDIGYCKKLRNSLLLYSKWTIRRDDVASKRIGPQRSGVCRILHCNILRYDPAHNRKVCDDCNYNCQ
jgi:hypothetical protein